MIEQVTVNSKETAEVKHSSKSPRRFIRFLLLGGAVAVIAS